MKTTTQFPVDPGTVVEVTCTYHNAVNQGSSQVTCTSVTSFTYETEPSCEIQGMCVTPFSMMNAVVKLTISNEPVSPKSYFSLRKLHLRPSVAELIISSMEKHLRLDTSKT